MTFPKLTPELPPVSIPDNNWSHLVGLQLADPEYPTSARIDILLGADIYGQLLDTGVIQCSHDAPVAHLTKLGWVITGPTSSAQLSSSVGAAQGFHCAIARDHSDCELRDEIQRFWVQEETPSSSSALTPQEQECEAHFISTHSR